MVLAANVVGNTKRKAEGLSAPEHRCQPSRVFQPLGDQETEKGQTDLICIVTHGREFKIRVTRWDIYSGKQEESFLEHALLSEA